MIKFLDIYKNDKELHSKILSEIKKFFKKGDFILGQSVSKFEKNFSKLCKSKFSLVVPTEQMHLHSRLNHLT